MVQSVTSSQGTEHTDSLMIGRRVAQLDLPTAAVQGGLCVYMHVCSCSEPTGVNLTGAPNGGRSVWRQTGPV